MKFSKIIAAVFALAVLYSGAFCVGGAFAFQEQSGGGQAPAASQPSASAGEQQLGGGASAGAGFGSEGGSAGAEKGTEVRIPGLGKLGVLPKMDFGLELLYGASEGKVVEQPQSNPALNDDDLRIRGTVKHRF